MASPPDGSGKKPERGADGLVRNRHRHPQPKTMGREQRKENRKLPLTFPQNRFRSRRFKSSLRHSDFLPNPPSGGALTAFKGVLYSLCPGRVEAIDQAISS